MAKSTQPDSTPKAAQSQDKFRVKASVYAQLRKLNSFEQIIFKRMADNKHPGAIKSLSEWDAFKIQYQNSGSTK